MFEFLRCPTFVLRAPYVSRTKLFVLQSFPMLSLCFLKFGKILCSLECSNFTQKIRILVEQVREKLSRGIHSRNRSRSLTYRPTFSTHKHVFFILSKSIRIAIRNVWKIKIHRFIWTLRGTEIWSALMNIRVIRGYGYKCVHCSFKLLW